MTKAVATEMDTTKSPKATKKPLQDKALQALSPRCHIEVDSIFVLFVSFVVPSLVCANSSTLDLWI